MLLSKQLLTSFVDHTTQLPYTCTFQVGESIAGHYFELMAQQTLYYAAVKAPKKHVLIYHMWFV